MTNIEVLYNKMLELKEFRAKDLSNIDIGTSRIGAYIYYFRQKGLIESYGRGKYRIINAPSSRQIINNLRANNLNDKYEILFGIELEMEYDRGKVGHIDRLSYHSNESVAFNKYFIAENDGSLSRLTFPQGETVELIGIPVTCNEMPKALESLKKKFETKTKAHNAVTNELNDIISFNQTTGAHMHISLKVKSDKDSKIMMRDDKEVIVKNGFTINPKIFTNYKFLKLISRNVRMRLKRELPLIYPHFSRSYFRGMAKKITERGIRCNDRYMEFNLNPDHTIEYRSLNLHGIKTWNDLFKFYRIVCETINHIFLRELGVDKPFNSGNELNVDVDDDVFGNINECEDIIPQSNIHEEEEI